MSYRAKSPDKLRYFSVWAGLSLCLLVIALAIPGTLPIYSAGPANLHGYTDSIHIPINRHRFKMLVREP